MKLRLICGMLLLSGPAFFSIQALTSQQTEFATQIKPPQQHAKSTKTGEQIFNDNCARCHTPPMAIDPRITGTVVMHMRTRARLSQEDRELLLKYLAP